MSTTETTATGTLPEKGTWNLEPAHSSAQFTARHLGLAKVRGHFETLEGTLEIGDDPTESVVDVTIDASSINTNQPDRDAHLRSGDFLDVEQYPTIRFRSTSITRDGDDWKMTGDLTIRDTTKPVTIDVEFLGVGDDPFGMGTRAAFEGSTGIIRRDYGLTWEGPQQAGGALVGKKVRIVLDAEFLRA